MHRLAIHITSYHIISYIKYLFNFKNHKIVNYNTSISFLLLLFRFVSFRLIFNKYQNATYCKGLNILNSKLNENVYLFAHKTESLVQYSALLA